jgi:diguanylate cyclase (GGDEF)-like protein
MNNLLQTYEATEEELSTALQSKSRFLTFSTHLEQRYLDQHTPRAIRRFHVLLPVISFLYAIIVTGITGIIPKSSFALWTTIVISVTLSILCTMALSFFPRFNHWIKWYGAFGSAVVISATIIITNLFPLGQNSPLLYAGIIFSILIVYTCVGLTLFWGLSANLIGGLSAVVIMSFMNIDVNWSLLIRIYICSSILGLGLSYALENQERKNFLNTLLLRLTIQKGEDLAKQLESLSRLDSLTGLANRRHLDEVLDAEWNRALRQNQPITIMLIDVDHFKIYNDKLGHLAGDDCLRQVAQLLAEMTKRGGELAARYGGEEFVLIYPAMDISLAHKQATHLIQHMENLAIPHPNGHFVSFTIGLCVSIPTPEVDIAQLLHNADTALYKAKNNGRNRYELYREPSEDHSDKIDGASSSS